MMNQLKRRQPAASAKEQSEPVGTGIEKLAGEEEDELTDGLVVDDVIGDVIQSQESAGSLHPDESEKRRRRGDPVASYSTFSRCYRRSYSRSSRNAKISSRNVLSIQSQEDSGEAFGQPDASNSSIQSRAYQLLLYIFSRELQCPVARFPDARIDEAARRTSRSDGSAAKQLTTYEEISKLDVNC
ncbi:hypothetical protein F511_29105 [Dorcoceras hygrometricum]|uniref:Uncharacterized protein n=1 Tax=Dorcoceras hygrometricum TaxID=472368 RepID=A0A2Z7D8Q3_9LAMI|nr:hypothetical protein F511_29105 [Dorcoceras hygrometricum]